MKIHGFARSFDPNAGLWLRLGRSWWCLRAALGLDGDLYGPSGGRGAPPGAEVGPREGRELAGALGGGLHKTASVASVASHAGGV